MEPRNRFQGSNFASLCSLAGRYDNPFLTRFLAPIDCLKILAQDFMWAYVQNIGTFPLSQNLKWYQKKWKFPHKVEYLEKIGCHSHIWWNIPSEMREKWGVVSDIWLWTRTRNFLSVLTVKDQFWYRSTPLAGKYTRYSNRYSTVDWPLCCLFVMPNFCR
jgi:hypothetical protein